MTNVGSVEAWIELEGVAPGKLFVDKALESTYLGMSVNATAPGDASPFWHRHFKLEELYIFLGGEGEFAADDDVIPVQAGTIVRVGPDTWHALRCLPESTAPLTWLCVRGGGDTLVSIGKDGELDRERPYPWA